MANFCGFYCSVDIVSHNIKLHKISEFAIDKLKVKLDEGVIELTARWPDSFLSQSYVLNGFLDGKKATGKGELKWVSDPHIPIPRLPITILHYATSRFRITVENFKVNIYMKFSDKGDNLRINDFKIRTDFSNAQVTKISLFVQE